LRSPGDQPLAGGGRVLAGAGRVQGAEPAAVAGEVDLWAVEDPEVAGGA
jgi:hypothetical protein